MTISKKAVRSKRDFLNRIRLNYGVDERKIIEIFRQRGMTYNPEREAELETVIRNVTIEEKAGILARPCPFPGCDGIIQRDSLHNKYCTIGGTLHLNCVTVSNMPGCPLTAVELYKMVKPALELYYERREALEKEYKEFLNDNKEESKSETPKAETCST